MDESQMSASAADPDTIVQTPEPGADTPLATLLVVDDDRSSRTMVRAVLGRERYRIIEAPDGPAAIDAVQRDKPDLILMDVMMPGMDGHEVCARIRQSLHDDTLPIVMLTAADDMASIERAFEAGATDFITKPINWPLLRERVRYALRGVQLVREMRRARLREQAVRRIVGLGYWEWRLSDDCLSWSEGFEPLAVIGASGGVGLSAFLQAVHPEDRQRLQQALERVRDTHGRLDLEFRLRIRQTERILRVVGERGTAAEDGDRIFGAFHDLTSVRRTEAMVDYLSQHDDTTGLPNRRLFLARAAQSMQQPARGDSVVLIGTIDIHRFGRYNESLGERGANQLLALQGQRLQQWVESGGLLVAARIGGDEFAVAIAGASTEAAVAGFRRALQALTLPVTVDRQELWVVVSGGWAVCPTHGSDAEALLTLAQEAQRRARSLGRDELGAETDGMGDGRRQRLLALEQTLQHALQRQEFELVYQPQMDFGSGRIVGCEALLRWRSPQWGVVSPAEFVPLLEESGLIVDVGAWVLTTAAHQAAQWARSGCPLRVGVNLSPRQFLAPGLFDHIQHVLQVSAVPAHLLELEITESLAMQDVDHSIDLLRRCRAAGLKVALDDFGVGHSSLAYVLQFPIDAIKIDRAFVTHVTRGRADRAIMRAIVSLGQSLGVDIIAEGVESQPQCDLLEAIGVTQIQGYLIGRPMSAAELQVMARDYYRAG
jgi:diguanylate cyclase (GGDEF)-like protein